ncbi:hexosaminidase D-like [Haliotis rufescens]|uniref:hexosaminidase D-like n=1 Tax=Haliotis rufescens TaxID=6454 RepID=UPI00201F42B6|nr:hexosaminidase D-like [Haliotis rufescens]
MASMSQRLVHLDLKGAAPKLSYLEKIFPLIEQWGATGLIMEYEDMFPYHGNLSEVASSQAYSVEEVKKILHMAEQHNLEVVPLVQTFGHFEFVLKHETFAKIREIPKYPTSLCPCHPDAIPIVTAMLDQVLEMHPKTRWFHIGCDEVYHLGRCDLCRRKMADENLTTQQLFFGHVKTVATYIKAHYPTITPIVWDDMFRFAAVKDLKTSGLGDLVEPMIWHYLSSFLLPENLFDNLCTVFRDIWVASAFKGATGVCASMTNISFHVENHLSWLRLIDEKGSKFNSIRGFAITGWQRYDHFAVMCELLPVAIPSLALCLSVAKQGVFTQDILMHISNQLEFKPGLPLNPYQCQIPTECRYPGSDVYAAMIDWIHTQAKCDQFLQSDTLCSWMNDYNIERGFVNLMHIEPIVTEATNILARLCEVQIKIQKSMEPIFSDETVTEWIQTYLEPKSKRLSDVVEKGQKVLGRVNFEGFEEKMSQDM